MTTPRRCASCNAQLEAGASGEACPQCLLAAAQATRPRDERSSPVPSPFDELARALPELEIQALIGSGGMGSVFRARHRELDRPVAVKLLASRIAGEPRFVERFAREARALARLDHPNIVRVHDCGTRDGLCYVVMEHVDGTNLRHLLASGRRSPERALAVAGRLCDALQHAHERGVVHRDIKPENILVDREGRVKVTDFGLARLLDGPDGLTGSGQAMGTPHYMAPEQIEGSGDVDHRADIYSLGVVLYEMLTGELPLGRFPLPSSKMRVDVGLDEVVLRALEKEPERRYQRASDVAVAVAGASVPGAAASRGRVPPLLPPGAMPRALVLAMAYLLSGGVVLLGLFLGIGAVVHATAGSPASWGLLGAALGCLLGGVGGLLGTWSSHRQAGGAENVLESGRWTAVDAGLLALLVVGVATFIVAFVAQVHLGAAGARALAVVGCIFAFQGGFFTLIRLLVRRAVRAEAAARR